MMIMSNQDRAELRRLEQVSPIIRQFIQENIYEFPITENEVIGCYVETLDDYKMPKHPNGRVNYLAEAIPGLDMTITVVPINVLRETLILLKKTFIAPDFSDHTIWRDVDEYFAIKINIIMMDTMIQSLGNDVIRRTYRQKNNPTRSLIPKECLIGLL